MPSLTDDRTDDLNSRWLSQFHEALAGKLGDPARMIAEQCLELANLLLEKNAAYGNAALQPLSIFSRGTTAIEKINVRIDDKLTRIARGHQYGEEDHVWDLAGYLVLRRIAGGQPSTGSGTPVVQ